MMQLQEIETAIRQLSEEDVLALSKWLAEYQAQMWDKQVEADLEAGRLDDLLAEIDAEYAALHLT